MAVARAVKWRNQFGLFGRRQGTLHGNGAHKARHGVQFTVPVRRALEK